MATKTAVTETETHESPMDFAEHQKSYQLFLSAVKWSIISTAVLLVLLYFIVQP